MFFSKFIVQRILKIGISCSNSKTIHGICRMGYKVIFNYLDLNVALYTFVSDSNNNILRLFPSIKEGESCLGHINHFCRIEERDELSVQ